MYTIHILMSFLAVAALAALIIGLFRPSIVVRWGTKQTRGRVLLYYGLGFLVLSIVSDGLKPQEIIEKENRERIEREERRAEQKEKERQERAEREKREAEQKEKEQQEALQKAQPILAKGKQQLAAARSAYKADNFNNAIASAQDAISTLQNIRHIPEASMLNDDAKTLLANAQEDLANAPKFTLTATALCKAYEDNEIAADSKYKGEIVLISGTIKSIEKMFGQSFVVLGSGSNSIYFNVQCFFEKSNEGQLASLSKGQRVRIKGVVSGKSMNISVNDCIVK